MKIKKITEIEKKKIIRLHKKGKTSKDIKNLLPHLSPQQIAAVKAHITMGSYN